MFDFMSLAFSSSTKNILLGAGLGPHGVLLAEGEGSTQGLFGAGLGGMPMMVLMVAVFYFIVLRPMKKQEKERTAKLEQLKKHDRVVLNNGIFGRVSSLDEKTMMLEIADRVKIKVKRSEVSDFEENFLKADDKAKASDVKKSKVDDKAKASDVEKSDDEKPVEPSKAKA